MNLLDESGRQKLVNLLPNDPALLLVEAAQTLLHWFGAGPDLQGMLGDLPRYARHIRGTPHNHVRVRAEEVDEHGFLFGIEVGADRQHPALGVARVEWDLLGAFCRLEASDKVLWFWSLGGEGLETRGKLSGALDYLPILDALDVALIGVLEGGADSEDFLGSGHLQLEVSVVGDGHELCVA